MCKNLSKTLRNFLGKIIVVLKCYILAYIFQFSFKNTVALLEKKNIYFNREQKL